MPSVAYTYSLFDAMIDKALNLTWGYDNAVTPTLRLGRTLLNTYRANDKTYHDYRFCSAANRKG